MKMCIRDRRKGKWLQNLGFHFHDTVEIKQYKDKLIITKVKDPNPVSYTHLDVYKRQIYGFISKARESINAAGMAITNKSLSLMHSSTPVSYTHLPSSSI